MMTTVLKYCSIGWEGIFFYYYEGGIRGWRSGGGGRGRNGKTYTKTQPAGRLARLLRARRLLDLLATRETTEKNAEDDFDLET